jgi:hypothetical protein
MSPSRIGIAAVAAAVALSGCGGTAADRPQGGQIGRSEAQRLPVEDLAPGLEAQTAAFLERDGTALRRNLHRYLGPTLSTEVERGSAVCRPGEETPSIADPRKYPFACIVRATADGQGLEVEIVLGFVGTELEGSCWRAANERVAVTSSLPELLSRREAQLPINQIAGCV